MLHKPLIILTLFILLPSIVSELSFKKKDFFQESTFYPNHFLIQQGLLNIDSEKREFLNQWSEYKQPTINPILTLQDDWKYELGDLNETLHSGYRPIRNENTKTVSIRHREFHPDRSMWYYHKLELDTPVVARIRADDGAQLFVNGEQVYQFEPYHYKIDAGHSEVTVRVLNNAVGGGLTSFTLYDQTTFQNYRNEMLKYRSLQDQIEKLKLLKNPPADFLIQLSDALKGHIQPVSIPKIPHFYVEPYLQIIRSSEYEIMWKSDADSSQIIFWNSTANQLKEQTLLPNKEGIFNFRADNLNAGDLYKYQIQLEEGYFSQIYTFAVPHANGKISFSAWGDSQNRPHILNQVAHGMNQFEDHFTIGLGDLVSDGANPQQWHSFFAGLSNYSWNTPLLLVAGNHDYDGYYDYLQPELYKKYSFDQKLYRSVYHENVGIIILDPNVNFPIGIHEGTEQHDWFVREIESDSWINSTWKIIALHQPPYAQSWPTYHGDKVIEELLKPLYEGGLVDVILTGHTHAYERLVKENEVGKKVLFVISGGAGGNLEPEENEIYPEMDVVKSIHHFVRFEIEGNELKLIAYSIDMRVFDEVIITR